MFFWKILRISFVSALIMQCPWLLSRRWRKTLQAIRMCSRTNTGAKLTLRDVLQILCWTSAPHLWAHQARWCTMLAPSACTTSPPGSLWTSSLRYPSTCSMRSMSVWWVFPLFWIGEGHCKRNTQWESPDAGCQSNLFVFFYVCSTSEFIY